MATLRLLIMYVGFLVALLLSGCASSGRHPTACNYKVLTYSLFPENKAKVEVDLHALSMDGWSVVSMSADRASENSVTELVIICRRQHRLGDK